MALAEGTAAAGMQEANIAMLPSDSTGDRTAPTAQQARNALFKEKLVLRTSQGGFSSTGSTSACNDSDDPSASDSGGSESSPGEVLDCPLPQQQGLLPSQKPSTEASGSVPPRSLALRALHLGIYYSCVVLTRVILSVRALLACFCSVAPTRPVLSRPEAKLSWELLTTSQDPVEAARAALPVPAAFPTPPPEGLKISFGPCANLMIYTGGVAACLRRCPNYAEVAPRLQFYGVSCGAFIASTMAADCDMLEMLPEMLSWTAKFQNRFWGLVGAYSESITAIVWGIFSDPERFERARNRLGITVTAFRPKPEHVPVSGFESVEELVTTLLGSCYIPVAFEKPQWSPKMGPLWDGGILEFATQGDIVVSPYESCLPEVFPSTPYPKSFTFFPPHKCDSVRIFEDGYMDCFRWLEAGAPMRGKERDCLVEATGSGIQPLLAEARRFLAEILWGPPRRGAKEHQA